MSDLEIAASSNESENNEITDPSVVRSEMLQTINEWYAGDLHTHSTYTNRGEIEAAGPAEQVHAMELVLDYATKLGRKFVVFAEHSSNPGDPQVLTADHPISVQILEQSATIKALNNGNEGAKAYSSVEANLLIDDGGEAVVDVPDKVLSELDFTVASIHAINNANKRDPKVLGALLLAAVQNPNIDEIGHPYRHNEFHPNDWDYFKKYWRDQFKYAKTPEDAARAETISRKLGDIDTLKDYPTLKKIIGKIPIEGAEPNIEEIENLGNLFSGLNAEYWSMWEQVFAEMEETGTIFEINLNSFHSNREYYQRLISLASKYPDLNYSLVFDFHNTRQHRKDIKEKDLSPSVTTLFPGRNGERKARGREFAARKLFDSISLLQQAGVTPDKVVNSSEESFGQYIHRRNARRAEASLEADPDFHVLADPIFLKELLGVDRIDGWQIDKLTRPHYGIIEKAIIEIDSGDESYRVLHNSKFDLERVYQVMRNLHYRIPAKSLQPVAFAKVGENPIIAYKSEDGNDTRHSAETLNHEERLLMVSDIAKLSGELHAIDPGSFVYWLNPDNASLERIRETINSDTIERIAQLDPDVAAALNSVYETISSVERELLKDSPTTLIHGDWHPGNIIRRPDGSLCVIDYKSFTYGIPERDVASMLQQIHDQFMDSVPGITDEQILDYQNTFIKSYPGELDPDKLNFYKSWISWRNSLFHYSRHYLGGRYNEDGRASLAAARKLLGEVNFRNLLKK